MGRGRRHGGAAAAAAPVVRNEGGWLETVVFDRLGWLKPASASEYAVWIATTVLCAGTYARHGLPLCTLYFILTAAACAVDPSLHSLQLLNLAAVVYDLSFELHRLYMLVSNRPFLMVAVMMLALGVEWLLERYEAEDSNDERQRGPIGALARLGRSVGRMLLPAVMGVLIACVGWLVLTAALLHPSSVSAPLVEAVEQVRGRNALTAPTHEAAARARAAVLPGGAGELTCALVSLFFADARLSLRVRLSVGLHLRDWLSLPVARARRVRPLTAPLRRQARLPAARPRGPLPPLSCAREPVERRAGPVRQLAAQQVDGALLDGELGVGDLVVSTHHRSLKNPIALLALTLTPSPLGCYLAGRPGSSTLTNPAGRRTRESRSSTARHTCRRVTAIEAACTCAARLATTLDS